jgi:phage terminase small subunit
MPRPLTPKQENFCQQFISTGNASEAYRQSYDCSKMKNTTINRAAHDLVENSKISARIGELQEKGRKRHDITVDSLTEQLQDAYGLAMQTGHAAAAVGASWTLAKLHGLDKPVQKKQEDLFPEIVIRVVDNPEPMGKSSDVGSR